MREKQRVETGVLTHQLRSQSNDDKPVDSNNNLNEYELAEYQITIDANRQMQQQPKRIVRPKNNSSGDDYGEICVTTHSYTNKLSQSDTSNRQLLNPYETILMNTANLSKINDYQDVDTYVAAASCFGANNQLQYDELVSVEQTKKKPVVDSFNIKAASSRPPQTLIACLDELQNGGSLISWNIMGQGENLTVKVTWNKDRQKSRYQIKNPSYDLNEEKLDFLNIVKNGERFG